MKTYRVRWEIDIEAESPEEAAEKALEIQRDPESLATVFEVFDDEGSIHRVDLLEELAVELDSIANWLDTEHP